MATESKIPAQAVAIQTSKVKEETYRLKQYVECIGHPEQRERAQVLFQQAYDALDALQSFLVSR